MIVSARPVNVLVRLSTVPVVMRHVGNAQPVIVGLARPRIDPAWVEVRIAPGRVVEIVSVQRVNGLVRRSTVLVGMRNVGIGRPVIVGHAPHRIVRVPLGILGARPVNGLVRRSTVLVGMRHVGTAQPVIVGHARPRIDPAWVEVRIVRGPRPQVTPIARSIARGWSVRATP